jgi:hypothetical protein
MAVPETTFRERRAACSEWIHADLPEEIGDAVQVYFFLAAGKEEAQTRRSGWVCAPSGRIDVEGICPARQTWLQAPARFLG